MINLNFCAKYLSKFHIFMIFKLRSAISSPSSISFLYTFVYFPVSASWSMQFSKYFNSLSFALFPSSFISGAYSSSTVSFKPRAAAFALFGFGVVATKWARSKIIISLNYEKSLKDNNRSMIYSSISSLRFLSSLEKYSMLKSGMFSASCFIKKDSIVSWYSLNIYM